MRCTSPFKKEVNGVMVELSCGQCMACRLNHARMWSIRISQEASLYKDNTFLTLTYDDEYLPKNKSLVKRDVQLFIKRFRKMIGSKVRYFLCGEYGDRFQRPHYHVILFGVPRDCKLFSLRRTKAKGGYRCSIPCWKYGFAHVGSVTVDSANYVAGYITKKLKGRGSAEYYSSRGIEPEFVLMSRRPGIGADFFMQTNVNLKNLDLFGVKVKNIPCPDFIQTKCPKVGVWNVNSEQLINVFKNFLLMLVKHKNKELIIPFLRKKKASKWLKIWFHFER